MARKLTTSQLKQKRLREQAQIKQQKQREQMFSHGLDLSNSKKSVSKKPSYSHRSDHDQYQSLDTGHGQATKKESIKYTGDKLIGIGMMHKSNLVPVFNEDQAKDISTMRRN